MLSTANDDVIIANPQRMFVDALGSAVRNEGMRVVHGVTTCSGLIDAVRLSPDAVCLTAWEFADGSLAHLIPRLRTVSPDASIVVVSGDSDRSVLSAALAVGVQGFIHTSRGLEVLLDAISRLRAGEIVIEASLDRPRRTSSDEGQRVRELANYLTPREYECLVLVASGKDTEFMARHLGVSRTTVRSHVQSMLIKLSVHSRLEAAALAVQHQLIADIEPVRTMSSA
jgi:two-component system, NarL family, nitrate/nitrite response regulator NarL